MADGGFDLSALLNDPTFQTGMGMIGTNAAIGPAFAQAAAAAQANKAAQQQNQLRAMQVSQMQARQNFNPSQYLLSNQQQQASPQAAGPATQAALAAQQGPQQGQQIAGQTQTPFQPPQGAIGNVDMAGLLSGAAKAGMSPEEAQQMAGVIDPMTAIRMKNMMQPSLVVPPNNTLVNPGLAMNQALFGQGGGAGGAQPQAGGQPGALYTNPNAPPDSKAGQIQMLQTIRDQNPVGTPKWTTYDAAMKSVSGEQDQLVALAKLKMDSDKTYGSAETMEPYAQSIANYQTQLPAVRSQTPASQALIARVLQINPGFDQTKFGVIQKASEDFATGPQGNTVRALNVAISHLNTLSNLSDALQNGDKPALNKIGNQYKEQTGQAAPTNFAAARDIVANEVTKAVTAGGGTGGDRDKAQETINAAQSPAQLKGAISTYQQLLGGQRQGLATQYKGATGRTDFETKFPYGGAAPVATKPVARTGMMNGRKVVQYQDGSTAYAD